MSNISDYISDEARSAIRSYIVDAGTNEVFLVGHVNKDRLVAEVQVHARGNEFSAPALLQVARHGDVVIHNHPSGVLRPSSPDLHVASILGNDGVGFYIVNNEASDVYVVVEPFEEKVLIPLNADLLVSILSEGGPVAKQLQDYEKRTEQLEMVRAVSAAMNEDKVAVIEAGTGTGKTLAYLLPAITYALNNKERVVISTNTINLQEQLINKDLPFLQKVLNEEFKAVLVKGRSNYACKRKLADADMELDLFTDEQHLKELKALGEWAATTRDGSKSDLGHVPRYDIWEKVQSESDTSLRTKCPFYSSCFFYAARRRAAVADILVVNHHLLFADLAVRAATGTSENAILPSYDRIIFDEAHNIEDVATRYFGTRVTSMGVASLLDKLHRKSGSQEKGLLVYFSHRLTRLGASLPHKDFIAIQHSLQQNGILTVENLKKQTRAVFEDIYAAVTAGGNADAGYREVKLRLTETTLESTEWQEQVSLPIKLAVQAIRKFTAALANIVKRIEQLPAVDDAQIQSMTVDLRAQLDRLDAAATSIEHVLLEQDSTNVRWLEVKKGYKNAVIVRFLASPLEVAPLLKSAVYDRFKNIIMTSATLTVDKSFNYLRQRFGLNHLPPEDILELSLPTPFDYKQQAMVAIPLDIPDPGSSVFSQSLPDILFDFIQLSKGRAFVLFTSYGLLHNSYVSLHERLERVGINCYKQGMENRHQLLERFKSDISSVLLATDSFWEGVDVQGESLGSVIIVKLPFKVPTEPIVQARVEAIENNGGNAFMQYSVPQAAIRFKQGFGRLIRRKTDCGTVLILDKRVVQKRYGKVFLNSLPACRMVVGDTKKVSAALETFYEETLG